MSANAIVEPANLVKQGTTSFTVPANQSLQNVASRGVIIFPYVDASPGGGSVIVTLFYRDGFGNDFPILSTAAISNAGPATPLVVYPGLLTVANNTLGLPLAKNWYIKATVTGTITYSLSYNVIP